MDSLQQELARAVADSNRIDQLFKLGESYWFNRNMHQAVFYLDQVIEQSAQKNYHRHSCNALLLLGHVYIRLQRFDSAMTALTDALSCAQMRKQDEHIPKVHQGLGELYSLLGESSKSIEHSLLAADGYEKGELPEINVQSIFAWLQAGKLFARQKQQDKALFYYQKALVKAQASGKSYLIKAPMIRVADIYNEQGKLAEAKKMYSTVVELDRKDGGADPTMDGLSGLGFIALKENKPAEAIGLFRAALDTAINRNFIISIDGYAANLGYAYFMNNQPDSAQFYYDYSLRQAQQESDLSVQQQVYTYLFELELKKGNLSRAIQYQQQAKTLADSVYNVQRVVSVNNLEILYETEKKEKEILALSEANAQKKLALVKRNRILLIGGIVAVAGIVVLGLLYRNNRQQRLIAEKEKRVQQQEIEFLEKQQQVVSLQSMINGQEAERTRIAKDLHDGLGGLFSTIKMQMSTLKHENKHLQQNELFQKSYNLVDNASVEVRRIAHNMMPEVLMKIGLVDALNDMCTNISAGKLLQVSLQAYGMEKRLNSSTEIMLYRIIQELVNNIIRHAQATEAIIQFNRDGRQLNITVEDNGKGFNTQEKDDKIHAGLETVQSRVNYLNGSFSIDSKEGMGTTIMMEFLVNE